MECLMLLCSHVLVLLRKVDKRVPATTPTRTAGMTFLYSLRGAANSLKVAGKEALYTAGT